MLHHPLSIALVLLAGLLAACGGERHAAPPAPLAAPSTAQADPARCDDTAALPAGSVRYRLEGGRCWRATTLLAPPTSSVGVRKRALAAAPTRLATPAELFDWAEVAYANFFPSHRSDLRLSTFTYRYYPESQNHVAVSDGNIFVQGPMSGGELQYVGTVEQYTCLALPALCNVAPVDCAPLAQWTAVDGSTCVPDASQTARIAHGASFTFTDNVGPLYGVAAQACDNGTLRALDAATCSTQAPAACNTGALTWSSGGNQCSPNPTEPVQIASGSRYTFSDSVQTHGQATYSCSNGTLSAVDTPSCNPRPAVNCTPSTVEWSASGHFCSADDKPAEIADGTRYTFVDIARGPVGRASFLCSGGTLVQEGTPTCAPGTVLDSFGDDGGSADGGASGDGTAADGAPLVGAQVLVTDTTGRTATATTDSRGYWRVRLTGMVPPLVVRVSKGLLVRHSVSVQPLRTDGFIFIAVTGLTDKIASDLADAARGNEGPVGAASLTPARLARLGSSAVDNAISALRNNAVVRAELTAAGLNPDTFDPLTRPFRADATGYDRVLDNLAVALDENGVTQVRSRICTLSEVSWTVSGNTCTAGGPSVTIKLNPGSTVTLPDTTGPTRGAAVYTCEQGLPKLLPGATCSLQ